MAEETKQEGYQPDPAATAPPGQEGQQPPEIKRYITVKKTPKT